jgi:hypothetical protein
MFDIDGKLVGQGKESNKPGARPAWGVQTNGANHMKGE